MSKKDLSVQNPKTREHNQIFSKSYLKFRSNLRNFKKKKLVVAVSGGPDSLALVAFTRTLQKEKKLKAFFVLIDHQIRKNSYKEAILVKKLLSKKGIPLTVLKNKKKIEKNIQSKAREVRYKLLADFCKKKHSTHLLTAHHSDDQIETFLIRLSRGSGVQGLSSMKKVTLLNNRIVLLRPLLDHKKKELIYVAKKTFGKFFKDPSNTNSKYLRTRIRNIKKILEKNGINHDQIIRSINNLSSTNKTLDAYISKVYKLNVKKKKNELQINFKNIFVESGEIRLKILSIAIQKFSKSYYPPRSKKVLNIIENLNSKKRQKFTLSKCLIEKKGNFISIRKEA